MAKRKRLVLPDSDAVNTPAPETKSAFPLGVARTRRPAAPIAAEAAEASSAAVAQDMADALHTARQEGRMVLSLPLNSINANYLVRDRTVLHSEDLEALHSSIAARGQQTPIEVVALEGGRYGLISGLRRLTVLGRLHASDPDGGFDTVKALLRKPDDSAEAYLAMVEENEIRVGLSYYERARIAAKAVDQGAFATPKAALLTLYRAASRAKRSKIRSFLSLVDALDGALEHPEQIGERLGLQLSAAFESDPHLGRRLRAQLEQVRGQDAASEKAMLEAALRPAPTPEKEPNKANQTLSAGNTAMDFQVRRSGQKLVVEGTAVTPALEAAVRAFLRDWTPS